ncbi:MAG: sialidase family protein [Sulfuricellaceae bacterium]
MMESEITLTLNHKKGNPRNSEGAFITLSDGRILFAYSRYDGNSWNDNAPATISAIYSGDEGRSWSARRRVLVRNEGGFNVMSPSLLRLHSGRIALFYLRKNHLHDCTLLMRTSADEGMTWSEPSHCIAAPGYFVVNNDRVIQLGNGRIVIPAAYHRPTKTGRIEAQNEADWRAITLFYYSDDEGETWHESDDWWGLPVRNKSGMQEPGLVELKDGSLYAWARTDTGRQWEMSSSTRGRTWTPPQASKFLSPCSALSIKRIPATGDLLAVWNDYSRRWKLGKFYLKSSWGRTPLVAAISGNEGLTWKHHKLLESDPRRGYCYTAIHFSGDAVLLAYNFGGVGGGVLQDLCIRRLTLEYLYSNEPT